MAGLELSEYLLKTELFQRNNHASTTFVVCVPCFIGVWRGLIFSFLDNIIIHKIEDA